MGLFKSKEERTSERSQEIVNALRERRDPPRDQGLSRQAQRLLEREAKDKGKK
jgi:hypothetical protein